MEKHLLDLGSAILAAIIVMIVHEIPKTFVYYRMNKELSKKSFLYALRIYHYIDPIGLIFCITTHGGFSKPYLYRIKDKRTNKMLGITGFTSLILLYLVNVILLKYYFGVTSGSSGFEYYAAMGHVTTFLMYFCFNMAFMSFGMCIVNLFPIATFDMGSIIAGVSPMKFFELLRKDYFMKIMVTFVLLLGVVTSLGQYTLMILLR